jgi:histidinol dehydrogenase
MGRGAPSEAFQGSAEMKINFWRLSEIDSAERERILRRAETDISEALSAVEPIVADVRVRGDAALCEYTLKFDGAALEPGGLRVSEAEFDGAPGALDGKLRAALDRSIANVRTFHERQMPEAIWWTEVEPGVWAGEKTSPIPSAGLYVPRGKGQFPSVMMMLLVPAVVAGVPEIVVATPPTRDGTLDAASLYVADRLGRPAIFKIGGAQGIAALAFGTESVPKVAKILGPGNPYVSAARRLVRDSVDTGMPAGPSESIILADDSAQARLVALDLQIEAEHGPDSAALLVTPSETLAREVIEALPSLVASLPEPRRGFVTEAFANYGGVVLVSDLDEGVDFANAYAPEHMEIVTAEPHETMTRVRNAGEILLGARTPIAISNFSLGPNAILPTGGNARTWSATGVWDFLKRSSLAMVTPAADPSLAEAARLFGEFEGFPAHAMAIRERQLGRE